MSHKLPQSIQKVIDELSRLPGIGPKTAGRLAFYMLTKPVDRVQSLGNAIAGIRDNLQTCEVCWNIAEANPCLICTDPARESQALLVVEEPLDVVALEKAAWNGRYHVLGGVISPINGIGPEQLRAKELFDRLKQTGLVIEEIILGTDPSLEGEATALYLKRQIQKMSIEWPHLKSLKITRLGRGLPMGSDLEYADELTLRRSIDGRNDF